MNKVAVGIDIGGTNTVFGLVGRDGEISRECCIKTTSFESPMLLAKSIYDTITKDFQKKESDLAGIGIGAPNGNFFKGTIEHAPNLAWKGIVELKSIFEECFHLPVYVNNDANLAALGEMVFGGAKGMQNFVSVTLGTGLGSGIVLNGELLYGHTGFAGELGHTVAVPQGRQCGCGKHGCLEQYASVTGVQISVHELISSGHSNGLYKGVPENEISGLFITEAARKGDPVALSAFDTAGKMLGMRLADLVALINPEAIFLFGGLANAKELILEPTKKYLYEFSSPIFQNSATLKISELLQKNAAVLGAGAMVWHYEQKK
ncbi:MAG: ROK family protein [Bacteroidota bacterium]